MVDPTAPKTFNPGQLNWAALAGLASGNNVGEQLGNANAVIAAQQPKIEEARQKSATYQALLRMDPEKAAQFQAGLIDGPGALRMMVEEKRAREEAARPKYQLQNINGKLVRVDVNAGAVDELADYSQPKLPAIAEEYNWMKTQGFDGTAQEYQAWKANQSKSGLMVESDGQGGFRMVQGDVSKLPPKLTETQSKDINFLGRAKKAEEALSTVESELTSFAQKRVTGLPYDIGNYLQTPEYQKAQQAGREILAVILRKDTGAAVTPQEFEMYSKIYLPQPGDDAQTIAAKKASRAAAIKGIQDGLGPLAPGDASQTEDPLGIR